MHLYGHAPSRVPNFRGGSRVEGVAAPILGSFRTCLTPCIYEESEILLFLSFALVLATHPLKKTLDSPLIFQFQAKNSTVNQVIFTGNSRWPGKICNICVQ